MTASTRRAALGAILAAPLTGGAVMALPSGPAPIAPSDLICACDWGVAHLAWINDTSHPLSEWPDERLHRELDRVDEVLDRIAVEPSASLNDLVAKVRLILANDGETLSMSDCSDDRAVLTVLREVIKLCA